MLLSIAIGCGLVMLTTFVHAAAMVAALQGLRISVAVDRVRHTRSGFRKAVVVASLVLAMFLASLIEAGLWAIVYLWLGAIAHFEEALYFSTVTYTTLGFGDVVMDREWRLLSAFEAANGIIMLGWTTALIVTVVQRLYFAPAARGERRE